MTNHEDRPEESSPHLEVGASADESWAEVGQQFTRLGESLAGAFASVWQDETMQEYVRQISEGAEKMAEATTQAVENAARSPEAHKLRAEAEKAANTARDTGKQAVESARPQLVSALEQLNVKLNELIDRINASQAGPPQEPEAEATPADEPTDASQVW